jgi:hypothetical protein
MNRTLITETDLDPAQVLPALGLRGQPEGEVEWQK